jgi:hypothetical protein
MADMDVDQPAAEEVTTTTVTKKGKGAVVLGDKKRFEVKKVWNVHQTMVWSYC